MTTVLITGGAGFFGDILIRRLLAEGFRCVSIDLEKSTLEHANLINIQGDIRDRMLLEKTFSGQKFDAVYHLAAILAHAVKDKEFLWTSNVNGTRNIVAMAEKFAVPRVIFTSSNCLWGEDFNRPIREDDTPKPVEIYGRSKWEAEKIIAAGTPGGQHFNWVTIRCPTIIDEGRLGLLAILFEFIDEGRKVWLVGGGDNRYQFIYAQDLVDACLKALTYKKSAIFNIGSDNVKTLKEVYQYVIAKANTKARVASLPRRITLLGMRLAYLLKMSPLGPYQYKMIASSFIFDTNKIKQELHWQPTLTNEEMLARAYGYYHQHRDDIHARTAVSAHRQAAKMGIIKLLKWLS